MARSPCIPDIIAEHLDELPFDCGRRASVLGSPRHVLADLMRIDERIAGRLDGLALAESEALTGAEVLLGGDPDERRAGALIDAALATPASWAALDAAARANPGGGWIAESVSLVRASPPERLLSSWAAADAGLRLAALEITAWRGGSAEVPRDLLAHQDPDIRARTWTLAALDQIEAGLPLDDGNVAVRCAALATAAWSAWPGLRAHCRTIARAGGADRLPELMMLAALAEPADDDVLASACADPALALGRFGLAMRWGRPLVAPLLIDAMASGGRDEMAAAGACFTHLFGIDLSMDPSAAPPIEVVDAFEQEFVETPDLPDVDRARTHWQRARARLEACQRVIGGLDASTCTEDDLDLSSRTDALMRLAHAGGTPERWDALRLQAELRIHRDTLKQMRVAS